MTDADIADWERIEAEFAQLGSGKYRAGVAEHGGFLPSKPVHKEIVWEAVDMVVYALTLKHQVAEVVLACKNANDAEKALARRVLKALGEGDKWSPKP